MQIRKNRCVLIEPRFLGDYSSKNILDELEARFETDVPAEIELQYNQIGNQLLLRLLSSLVWEARIWRNAQMWKKQALDVPESCLSKDIADSR